MPEGAKNGINVQDDSPSILLSKPSELKEKRQNINKIHTY
jgi:hypothetical protein